MANGLFQDFNPIQRLAANQYDFSTRRITKGSLISFHYPRSFAMIPNVIHDPYPMVILTDIWPQYIRGLNLHYLTFPYIKNILSAHGGNAAFSYVHIKPDKYMAQAFRMYVRAGVRRPRRLDTQWLMEVLASVRSFAPGQLEAIRKNIEMQIQQRLQTKADELTSYEEWRAQAERMTYGQWVRQKRTDAWWNQLTESQKRQFRGKALEGQRILTGGIERDLVRPEGPPTEEGGPFSTEENL